MIEAADKPLSAEFQYRRMLLSRPSLRVVDHVRGSDELRKSAARLEIITQREAIFWASLAALVMLFIICWHGPGGWFADDTYQYLSVAGNIFRGNGLVTSVVHFDAERRAGTIPAPLTTFPPGYPIAIAALGKLGIPLETAAVWISRACFAAVLVLVALIARELQLSKFTTRVMVLLLALNPVYDVFGNYLLTEEFFMLFCMIALLLLVRYAGQERVHYGALILAGIAVGLSYSVRYAGVFLCASAAAYFGLSFLARRDRRSLLAAVVCCGTAAIPVAAIMARNISLVGTWKGGNDKQVANGVMGVSKYWLDSIYHLVFGEAKFSVGVWELLIWASVVAVILVVWVARPLVRGKSLDPLARLSKQLQFPLLFTVVYMAGMAYLSLRSVISFGPRMLLPLLPVGLIIIGALLDRSLKQLSGTQLRLAQVALVGVCFGAAGVCAREMIAPRPLAPHEVVAQQLTERGADGLPMISWIRANVAADATLAATGQGQALNYYLQRNTLSFVGSVFSNTSWDEQTVANVMKQYGIRFLFIFRPNALVTDSVPVGTGFLSSLATDSIPAWLEKAQSNKYVLIFRRIQPQGSSQ